MSNIIGLIFLVFAVESVGSGSGSGSKVSILSGPVPGPKISDMMNFS